MRFSGVFLLLLCSCLAVRAHWDEDDDDRVSTEAVDAVLGRSVTLPCDIEPATREDRVYMVLWFRDDVGKPIYSFDVRGRPFTKALYWSDAETLGPRGYFVTGLSPAGLTIDAVTLDDEGVYRCRVDFKDSPTRNFQVNLTVIVPPHQLLVYDSSGREVVGAVSGLLEGNDLVLTCEVRGGRPPPTVSWFVDDRLTEGQLQAVGRHVVVNRLEVPRVSRQQLNTAFKCQASNTKLVLPQEKTVRLDLLLRPLKTRLLERPSVLEAGQTVVLECEAVGSRPEAVISWWRDNYQLDRGKVETDGNETVVLSRLTFQPLPDDDGHVLRCHAENPRIPASGLEAQLHLNVVYAPVVRLQLGNSLNPDDIKENDDVYFECSIRANPKEHRIAWLHDGVPVVQNMSAGVILSTDSLVLQGVTRHHAGSYTCVAANERGETASRPVFLRVRFAPVCAHEEPLLVGASLGEAVRVRCRVAADPADDVSFEWQFNNSGESFGVPPARLGNASGPAAGELSYAPASDRDYGTLACWARNAVGRQAEPCVFQVLPAERPGALSNCSLRAAAAATPAASALSPAAAAAAAAALQNASTAGGPDLAPAPASAQLVVECVAGHDGGLPQRFFLEAHEAAGGGVRLNTSSAAPRFRLQLAALGWRTLRLVLYAANARGRGDATVLDDIALGDAEMRTELTQSSGWDIVPLAALLTGALLAAGLAVLLVAVLAVRRRRAYEAAGGRARGGGASGGGVCSGGGAAPALQLEKQPPPPQHGSMLEINHGHERYVVSYRLKTAQDSCVVDGRQPDILKSPRAADSVLADAASRRQDPSLRLSNPPDSEAITERPAAGRPQHSPPAYQQPPPVYPPSPARTPPPLPARIRPPPGAPATAAAAAAATATTSSSSPSSSSAGGGVATLPAGALSPASTAPSTSPVATTATVTPPFVPTTINRASNGTLRKDHLISDSIPGPESCV
ncbi:neural cell adhesion molecule 1-like isoform X2 [Schistocerca gregaria]|uniref:neural cell adhesion molecule 1-like isoform X2 n=1 Tax=Schistocerca gregaria TaxID=7010 RepID=UPI00211EE378|nr:neural cell adhesion molecule 1-like isoform X2 [Schistocerca gregaria]